MAQAILKCTAEEFAKKWKKYDADGNGYIEDSELSTFLTELAQECGEKDVRKFTKDFMSTHDTNKDGKIDMKELAAVLNKEENFLLLIRTSPHGSPNSVEFMKIWNKYDADNSCAIESGELKSFLKDVYDRSGNPLQAEKLDEYTRAVLELYDTDGNGKLNFKEMIKLLPLANNFLLDLKALNYSEDTIAKLFRDHDKNKDATIAGDELDKLLTDLLRKVGKPTDRETISKFKKSVLEHCDVNKDGKIQLPELRMLFK